MSLLPSPLQSESLVPRADTVCQQRGGSDILVNGACSHDGDLGASRKARWRHASNLAMLGAAILVSEIQSAGLSGGKDCRCKSHTCHGRNEKLRTILGKFE